MAKLYAKERNSLSSSTFGLPGQRKYPMPDRSHAGNAKARAAQQVKAGNLSPASEAKIDAKANGILGMAHTNKPHTPTKYEVLGAGKDADKAHRGTFQESSMHNVKNPSSHQSKMDGC